MGFADRVFKEVSKIKRGKVISYSEIALRSGFPKASRAVGNVLSKNQSPEIVPCHRVIRKDGGIGGYAWGVKKKIKLLKSEGIKIKGNKITK